MSNIRERATPRTDQLTPETGLSWSSYMVGQAAYVGSVPAAQRQKAEQHIMRQISGIPLTEWIIAAKHYFLETGSEISSPAKIDLDDATLPTSEELEHPYFWLKLLRHNEATILPNKDESRFFYEKALETAVVQVEKGNTQARPLMFDLFRNLLIDHTEAPLPSSQNRYANELSLISSLDLYTRAIDSYSEKILQSSITAEQKLTEIHKLISTVAKDYDFLPRPTILKEVIRAIVLTAVDYFTVSVANHFDSKKSSEEKIRYFSDTLQPFLNNLVEPTIMPFTRGNTRNDFHTNIAGVLIRYAKETVLPTFLRLELLAGLLEEAYFVSSPESWDVIRPEIQTILNECAADIFTAHTVDSFFSFQHFSYTIPSIGDWAKRYVDILKNNTDKISSVPFGFIISHSRAGRISLQEKAYALTLNYSSVNAQQPYAVSIQPLGIGEHDLQHRAVLEAYREALYLFQALTSPDEFNLR